MSKISFKKFYSLLETHNYSIENVYSSGNECKFIEITTPVYNQKFFIYVPDKYIMNVDIDQSTQIRKINSKKDISFVLRQLREVFDVDIKFINLSCYSLSLYDPISDDVISFSFKIKEEKKKEVFNIGKIQLLEKEIEEIENDEPEETKEEDEKSNLEFEDSEETVEDVQEIVVKNRSAVKVSDICFGVVYLSFTILDFINKLDKSLDEKTIIEYNDLLIENLNDVVLNRANNLDEEIVKINSLMKNKITKNQESIKLIKEKLISLREMLIKCENLKQKNKKESVNVRLNTLIDQIKKEFVSYNNEILTTQNHQDELLSDITALVQEFNEIYNK